MFHALLHYNFLQNALISCMIVSVLCGFLGPIILERKMVFITGGIAHTSFGGIGMGYWLGFSPLAGGLCFSILAALGIGKITRQDLHTGDTLIGILWSMSMAMGIIFVALTPGYPPAITSYIFGDVLAVTTNEVVLMGILTLVVVVIIIALFHPLKAFLFDSEFARIQGLRVIMLEYILFVMLGISIVVIIQAVGFILIFALFTAPAAIAKHITFDLKKIIGLTILISLLASITGLWFSYRYDLASGAVIILFVSILYLLTLLVVQIRKQFVLYVQRSGMSS